MPAFTALADDPLIAGNRAKRLRDLLIAKRQVGIAVHVIYDSYGSGSTQSM
jgi:hypothetical protein